VDQSIAQLFARTLPADGQAVLERQPGAPGSKEVGQGAQPGSDLQRGGVGAAGLTIVLLEHHVQRPVVPVLDGPVQPHQLEQVRKGQFHRGQRGDEVAPLGILGAVVPPGASVARTAAAEPRGSPPRLAKGMQPWRAVRAELVGPDRRTLRVYPPWQREPLSSDAKDRRVVIEAEATEAEAWGSFTLKLWNEDGTRSVIVTGVTFP
jgi:hypothetical protein